MTDANGGRDDGQAAGTSSPVQTLRRNYRRMGEFREQWAPTVVTVAEVGVALALTVGLGYWLYLYLVVGA